MMKVIKSISGPEPLREGEYPDSYTVGNSGVTRIESREQNLGTYGIIWFDIFSGETIIASVNGLYVASIVYAQKEKE